MCPLHCVVSYKTSGGTGKGCKDRSMDTGTEVVICSQCGRIINNADGPILNYFCRWGFDENARFCNIACAKEYDIEHRNDESWIAKQVAWELINSK